MGKAAGRSYQSPKVIGRMFRSVDLPEPAPEHARFPWGPLDPKNDNVELRRRLQLRFLDESLCVPGYEAHLTDALMERKEYERGLIGLMRRYEVFNEAELLTGCIRKFSR